ncbi:hypothetical protein C7E23_03080 [Elizabethkingia anophelis]|nr:hypothetical protein C7E23_03080 [Elizabethkingia anophelis]
MKKSAKKNKYLEDIELYVVNKVYNIIETYDFYTNKYKQAFDNFTKYIIATTTDIQVSEIEPIFSETINKFFVDIKEDPSHISVKFKQAVNFIKYNNLQYFINNNIEKTNIDEKIELDTYNNLIIDIQNNNQNENISIIEFLPPAIFKIEFYLDDPDQSNFSQASSGEYQLMSVLSSILYHIRNIDSVDNQYSYRYIAIILDEVELYFHPNMQRNFIRKLILALSKLECNIWSMHILFATHSPFILSDIVQQKILKISNGEVHKIDNNYNSFAANIHDLLADEFFFRNRKYGSICNSAN